MTLVVVLPTSKTQILHTDHIFFIFQSLEFTEKKKSIELGKKNILHQKYVTANAEAVAIHCHCWVCLLTGAPRLVSWSVLGTVLIASQSTKNIKQNMVTVYIYI